MAPLAPWRRRPGPRGDLAAAVPAAVVPAPPRRAQASVSALRGEEGER